MINLMKASPMELADLESRAIECCIVFRNQELPPLCDPPRADVGIEINGEGATTLLIQKGISYGGPDIILIRLLETGAFTFDKFSNLVEWLAGLTVLSHSQIAEQRRGTASKSSLDDLTDYTAIDDGGATAVQLIDASELTASLAQEIVGQHQAIRTTAAACRVHSAKISSERPLCLFYVGGSGVGKTSLAKTLAGCLGDLEGEASWTFLRVDCNEYQEAHRVSQLLGAPPGYSGYGDGSTFTKHLATNPRTIVLFDEWDKAADALHVTIMNAMDSGRFSVPQQSGGAAGQEIDCRQAIFIFTSNQEASEIVTEIIRRKILEDQGQVAEICRRHLQHLGMRPEILGRMSHFAVFLPLDHQAKVRIIAKTIARCGEQFGVNVAWIAPGLIDRVLAESTSNNFGVRTIEYLVEQSLAETFIAAKLRFGAEPVEIIDGDPPVCLEIQFDALKDRPQTDEHPADSGDYTEDGGKQPIPFRVEEES